MEIVVSQMQGRVPITVFQLKGDLDANFHDQLLTKAKEVFETGTKDMILDLTQVKYMSSSGLQAIHHIFMMLRSNAPAESDGAMRKGLSDGTFKSPHLKLVNPSPNVHNVLKTTGFDMFLEIHHNLKEAVASF